MKIKIGISIVLALFAFIFITQNTANVTVVFMAWSVEMSLVLLVFIMLVAGLIIGWSLNSYLRFIRNRKRDKLRGGIPTNEVTKSTTRVDAMQGDEGRGDKDVHE